MNTVQNFDTDDLEHTDLIKNTDLYQTIQSVPMVAFFKNVLLSIFISVIFYSFNFLY